MSVDDEVLDVEYVASLPSGTGGPCSWEFIPPEDCTLVNVEDFYDMAAEFLWRWTGRVFGLCDVQVRPCKSNCGDATSTYWGGLNRAYLLPALINGKWYNLGCLTCGSRFCKCDHTEGLALPGPIQDVTEVRLNGEVLDPSEYRVSNRRYLVRTNGERWPTCQNLNADVTEDDTFQVSYTRGVPVPVGGQRATGLLACEFARAYAGDDDCQLPKRLQSITRQGVTVAVLDSFDDMGRGQTGIWAIDAWVASVTKSPRRSTVRSPDYRG